MANVAISALPVATSAATTDLLPIVQGGTTKQLTNALLFTAPAIVSGTTVTTPTTSTALVNKQYVDAAINGLNSQIACNYASTGNFTVTYNNGTSGVGATLTATTNGTFFLDGVTPTVGQRVLIKSQTAALQNGAYSVTQTGGASTPFILTRVTDYDQSAEMAAGDSFYIISGSTLANTTWVQQTPAPITVGTDSITFTQFAGTGAPPIKQPYNANGAVYATSTTALVTGTLPITGGGTGATTASTALNNLGGVSTGKAIAMAIVFGG